MDRGLTPKIDAIGNQFGVATLAPASADVVLVGSHLDSQPTGGRYDGVYGVLAGLLAVEAVKARCLDKPAAARRNLAVVNWTNEEGARFQPSLTGSSVFTGALSLEDAYACADGEGTTLGEALSAIGYLGTTPLDKNPVRYVELHVEQADSLEKSSTDIAAVFHSWTTRKISVIFEGDYSHTGSTPMALRRDALRAAGRAIEALYQEVANENAGAHAAAARISVYPNSPNVVAGRVRVWFEIRHEDEAVISAISDRFLRRIERESADIKVAVSIAVDERRLGTALDPDGVALILSAAADLGFKAMTLKTSIGHDALAIQKCVPSSLIFVPSQGGLSHNPREFTAPEALDKGYAVLTEVLWNMVTAKE
ncbi:N-carbamoyl-L-amino-acid hydrolase [Bradyrhizobium yuanmingense]|uniref:Zn-dependent hydrolase n=1 Tax=Bradyrhizobium yuanmingense TaxID=108015 RepID=UPI003515A7A8